MYTLHSSNWWAPAFWFLCPGPAPYPPGCTSSHLRALLFLQNFCLRYHSQNNQNVSNSTSAFYFRYFLTVTNTLLASAKCWTDFFREIPSDSKITPERLQLIWNHFYVFTIKIDFPHVQHFMFIWSGRVISNHFGKKNILKVVLPAFQTENCSDSSLINCWPPPWWTLIKEFIRLFHFIFSFLEDPLHTNHELPV